MGWMNMTKLVEDYNAQRKRIERLETALKWIAQSAEELHALTGQGHQECIEVAEAALKES